MNKPLHNALVLAAGLLTLLAASACSTQKNTWAARRYHALTTRYNVRFNGEQSYLKGMDIVERASDDYSRMLPVFPAPTRAAEGSMNACIAKCEKAISEHSIRVKPAKKPARNAKEKERLFYEHEEFNPVMGGVFLLMAKAQLYKADYLSSIATSAYIVRHFALDKELCDQAKLWMARAYYESDWMYEAENILVEMNQTGFSREISQDFALTYADFLVRREEWDRAADYLEIALSNPLPRPKKMRYTFLLAQLHQQLGHREKAYRLFKSVPHMNPPYEMELNARIRMTETDVSDSGTGALRKLRRLSRNPNNANYLDAIYYAMGNVYFQEKDTLQAVESYRKAIALSKQSPYKRQALQTLGSFFYDQEAFVDAEPCYSELKGLVKEEEPLYKEVQFRSEVLSLLAPSLQVIHEQDSLLDMASWPVERLETVVDSLVKAATKKAREEARQKAQEEALAANEALTEENRANSKTPSTTPSSGLNTDDSWYFYNRQAKENGKREFERLWGRRTLADNWRIRNKGSFFEDLESALASAGGMGVDSSTETDEGTGGDGRSPDNDETLASDSTASKSPAGETAVAATDEIPIAFEPSDDPTHRGYYLQNIPFTAEQKAASEAMVLEAMYEAGSLFYQRMLNRPLAVKTYREFRHRFPQDTTYLPEVYFESYLMLYQDGYFDEAGENRDSLLTSFPDTEQAAKLRDPQFLAHLREMYHREDSLFAETYRFFEQGHSAEVVARCDYMEATYPYSDLRPNFLFIRALEAVKEGNGELYLSLITELAGQYATHDIGPLAQAMLDLWNQGKRPVGFDKFYVTGEEAAEDSAGVAQLEEMAARFQYTPGEAHTLFVCYPDSVNANHLLFDVALHNFTNYVVRDYELSLETLGTVSALAVREFENLDDLLRYRSMMSFQGIPPEEKYPGLEFLPVSETNLDLLRKENLSLEAYRLFISRQ